MIPFNENEEIIDNRSGIYAIINIKTKKFYIGSAMKFSKRKNLHLHNLRKGKHHSKYLQNSYNKHGEDVFVFKVLEYVEDENNLLKVEQKYLDIYFHTGATYNICSTAGSQFGTKHTNETKIKLALIQKGKKHSECSKKKMSLAKQNIKNETKKKLSDAQLKKPVIQLDINNNILTAFNSMTEAERITGIPSGNISRCCNEKCKSAGGYIWRIKDDINKKNIFM